MLVGFDTETLPIGPDALAPRIICASFHNEDESFVISNGDLGLKKRVEFALRCETITGANTRYDLACVGSTWPDLIPLIFKALEDGRVHDVQIREKLANLWRHGQIGYGPAGNKLDYSLASLTKKYVGVDMSATKQGDDIWRLRYHELDGIPALKFPAEAYEYARFDAEAAYRVHRSQPDCPSFRTEPLHVYASFCLYLMTAWGLEIDAEEKARIEAELDEALDPKNMAILYEVGILTPAQPPRPHKRNKVHSPGCRKKGCACPPVMCKPVPEKLNKKEGLLPLVNRICKQNGIEPELTDKGKELEEQGAPFNREDYTSTGKDFIESIRGFDPALGVYAERQSVIKLKTSYMPSLEWPFASGEVARRVHPKYDPLKRTGRVSSSGNTKQNAAKALYPSVAIQLADPRVRSVYKPRDGHVFSVVDYNAIDLCSLAETVFKLFGFSTHRNQFNSGVDPHTFLGAVLAYDAEPEFRKDVYAFRDDDQRVYEYFLSLKATDENFFKHYRKFAKPVGLGFPGGMGINTMVGLCGSYGFTVTPSHAKRLKKIWLKCYPEMRGYLDWVSRQGGTYTSPMGMVRVNCIYTELANGKGLQTPAAEGMKVAMCLVSRACYDSSLGNVLYGCKPVINMHDELVLEVPEDDLMWARAEEHSRLMVEGMGKVIKNVKIRAEPELVRRWTKSAAPLERSSQRSDSKVA